MSNKTIKNVENTLVVSEMTSAEPTRQDVVIDNGSDWVVKQFVCHVVKPKVEFINKFLVDENGEYILDANGKRIVERDDNNLAIKRKKMILHLDTPIPCTSYDAIAGFDDTAMTTKLSFPLAEFQRIVGDTAPFAVTRLLTKFYAKTHRTLVEPYVMESLMYNADIIVSVRKHLKGEEYVVGDERRQYAGTKYEPTILDITIDEDSLEMFKEDLAENIADVKAADDKAKVAATSADDAD